MHDSCEPPLQKEIGHAEPETQDHHRRALPPTLSLIVAGCSLAGTEGDPYSAGQKARTEVDKATAKAGDFVAGSAAQPRCRSRRSGWSSCCGEPRRTDDAALPCAKDT